MKLAWKLTLALFVGLCAVLFANAYFRVKREIALFEAEARRDHHVLGRSLAVSIAEVWRVEGESRALELLSRVNEAESHVLIRWVRESATGDDGPRHRSVLASALATRAEATFVDRTDDGVRRVSTYVPVDVESARGPGAIELVEPLDQERAYVATTIKRFIGYTALMAAVAGAIAMSAGLMIVGRPMQNLISHARAIGAGDFEARIDLSQRDEIGELAVEMNHMSSRLEEAHRRVAAETAARIATIEQLRHADRLMTVGKLASGIAHELGTPLNVVSGRAKMIAAGSVTPAEVADNARIIAEQAARITSIVRQLLDFARRRTPARQRGNLARLVEQTVLLLAPMAEKQKVTIAIEPAETEALFDANQIQQAVTNLVVNAIQSMPSGGEVRVRVMPREVDPPADIARRSSSWLAIAVSDQGPGIPPEDRERIFEPFFTTKNVGEGTGLGLSVSYGIVREHGGWIDVESQPGSGSTFRIHLPPENE